MSNSFPSSRKAASNTGSNSDSSADAQDSPAALLGPGPNQSPASSSSERLIDLSLGLKPRQNSAAEDARRMGAAGMRLDALYFERLAHYVRSKMSVPAAVIQEQLAGTAVELCDLEASADALNQILLTLEPLDWGRTAVSAPAAGRERIQPGELNRYFAAEPLLRGIISGTNLNCTAAAARALPAVLPVTLAKSLAAFCRYFKSFSSLSAEQTAAYCRLEQSAAAPFLRLCFAPPAEGLRAVRCAQYRSRGPLSLQQLIESDQSAASLLLFAPLAALEQQQLAAIFRVDAFELSFDIDILPEV